MPTTADVWNQFGAALREFIRRRVRDEHVAEDLLQEVFVRVHRKLDSLTDDDRLVAWLLRIARNVIFDHHRGHSLGELNGTEMLEDHRTDDADFNQQLATCAASFVAYLPAEYREAVELAELKGMPQKAIARRIGLSLSGTKSRVQRGRRLLKAMLLECCQFEFDRSGNVVDYEVNGGQACCRVRPQSPA